jgi:hypothetical protein
MNSRLHQNGISPANHNVEYARGWYYIDGEPRRAPDVTRRSKELEENPDVGVFYSEPVNTFVLAPLSAQGMPMRHSVRV